MNAPTDREAALAMLRERFPESEGWRNHSVTSLDDTEAPDFHAFVRRETGPHNAPATYNLHAWSDSWENAARDLIASWDSAIAADPKVRALVEAAEAIRAKLQWHPDPNVRDEPNAAEDEIDALILALAALPASLRGKGGGA